MRVRYMRARIPFWRVERGGANGWKLRIACLSTCRRAVLDESATFVPSRAGETNLLESNQADNSRNTAKTTCLSAGLGFPDAEQAVQKWGFQPG